MSRKNRHKYISRVQHKGSSTNGWQVRVPTKGKDKQYRQSFFSDGVFKGKEASLAAAIAWRNREAGKLGLSVASKRALNQKQANSSSGFIGLARVNRKQRNNTICEAWEARYTVDGVYTKKCFSLAKYGETGAFVMACQLRYEMAGPLHQVSESTLAPCEPPVPIIKAYENEEDATNNALGE